MKFPLSPSSSNKEGLNNLKRYLVLQAPLGKEFDRITEATALVCESPYVYISFFEANAQIIKSKIGPLKDKVTALFMEVDDYKLNGGFKELFEGDIEGIHEVFEGDIDENHIKYYASQSILDGKGAVMGALIVLKTNIKPLSLKEKNLLLNFSEQIADLFERKTKVRNLFGFENLFKTSHSWVLVGALNGDIHYYNSVVTDMTQYSEHSLAYKSFYDMVHPEDVLMLKNAMSITDVNQLMEIRIVSLDEKEYTLECEFTIDSELGLFFSIGRNITNELALNIKQANSENKMRSLFENSPIFMITHRLNGEIISINKKSRQFFGHILNTIVHPTLYDLIPKHQRKMVDEYLEEIAIYGKADGQISVQNQQGNTNTWLYNNSVEFINGEDPYVIANAVDITDRVMLQQKLENTNELLNRTNNAAQIGSWEFEMLYEVSHFSDTTLDIFDFPKDGDPRYFDMLQQSLPQYQHVLLEKFQEGYSSGAGWELEFQILTYEGRKKWLKTIGYSVFETGECTAIYGTVQDITEFKKIQEELIFQKDRLQAFINHVPASVMMLDKNLDIIAVSNLWGEDEAGSFAGKVKGLNIKVIHPQLTQKYLESYKMALKGHSVREMGDTWNSPLTGKSYYINWEVHPWLDPDKSIGGVLIFSQDATEEFDIRKELEKSKNQAVKASISKSIFLENMSHEVRNPLNGIIGFTDLLSDTPLNDLQMQYLKFLNQSASQLQIMVNDILDFSKIDAEKLESQPNKINLYDFAHRIMSNFAAEIQLKGLQMELKFEENLPKYVYIDEVNLRQVLLNIIGNAIKYTAKGKVIIHISSSGELTYGMLKLKFEVQDSGLGMTLERSEFLHQILAQEERNISPTRIENLGLGLMISKRLLKLMNTELQFDSKIGKGSIFYFILEVKVANQIPLDIEWIRNEVLLLNDLNKNQDIAPKKVDIGLKKVLLMDDNAVNLSLLNIILNKLNKNIQIIETSNIGEALKLCKTQNFDFIFTNRQLRDLESVHLIKTESAKNKNTPIIAITDDLVIEENQNLIALGIDDVLHQPIKVQNVKELLQKWLKAAANTQAPKK